MYFSGDDDDMTDADALTARIEYLHRADDEA